MQRQTAGQLNKPPAASSDVLIDALGGGLGRREGGGGGCLVGDGGGVYFHSGNLDISSGHYLLWWCNERVFPLLEALNTHRFI